MKKSQRLGLLGLLLCFSLPTNATLIDLDVVYTNPSIIFGPLSLGLAALPEEVEADFSMNVTLINEGQETEAWEADAGDVVTASISVGNATWTTTDLSTLDFSFSTVSKQVTTLNYNFNVLAAHLDQPVTLNNTFTLTVTGTDDASGQDFEYLWSGSAQTLSGLPIPAAGWLFGSGLIALIGIARRKRAT